MSNIDESKCEQCGRCCLNKYFPLQGSETALLDGGHCPLYNPETHLCKEYALRHTVCPSCLSIPEAIAEGVLPNDCPYVAELKTYKSRVDYSRVVPQQQSDNPFLGQPYG